MSVLGSQLTQDQLKEYRAAFRVFDEYGDGQIPMSKLGKTLRSLGQNPNQKELQRIIDSIDETGRSSRLDFATFIGIMVNRVNADVEEEVREAFRCYDKHDVGWFEAADLRHVLRWIEPELSNKYISSMLKSVDVDPNGRVTFEAFRMLMLGMEFDNEEELSAQNVDVDVQL